MYRPLSSFVAIKFLQNQRQRGFLSFITVVSCLGFILGVATLVVVTAVLNGFEGVLKERILGMVPHSTLYVNKPTDNFEEVIRSIQTSDARVKAISPLVQTRATLVKQGEFRPFFIYGIEPKFEKMTSDLESNLIAGEITDLQPGTNHIILGEDVMREYDIHLGDSVSVFITKPSSSSVGITSNFFSFRVVGAFRATQKVEQWMSYASMSDVSKILEIDQGALAYRLKLEDVFLAPQATQAVEDYLESELPEGYEVTTRHWFETHGSLYDSIRKQKNMMSLLLSLIIIVAAFNVVSVLMILVTDKRSDIAILKTIGAPNNLIRRIFIKQGLFIGGIGTVIGLALGLLITAYIEPLSILVNRIFDLNLFDAYFVEALPAKIVLSDLIIIVIGSLIIAFLATLYPAHKASALLPAEALRYE